jgi:hypothetical protein
MNKIPIDSPERLHSALMSVKSAAEVVSSFDWSELVHQIELFEGMGAVIDPTMFHGMQNDPHWEFKKRLFKAAMAFTEEFDNVGKGVLHEE